ncbi:carbon storage regulator CsrA [Sanguibacter antarcticus]|uniref:Translational regulator CsrA n=1 Tax=Sanguibacter antarcticus TaxID=372484 RepID=A0A2A9E078_9MICO|nr:carbon storage regulator CsrA [Sanguibacter antarcticus]PFG32253.1 carbon storage regulator CsrA [Sanguibacter antarcticus]
MLVLSRRVGEKLLIGDDIVITIIDTRGDGVRIGIEAPRSTRVNRAEVVEAVTASNLAAIAAGEGAEDVLRQLVRPASGTTPAPTASTEPDETVS